MFKISYCILSGFVCLLFVLFFTFLKKHFNNGFHLGKFRTENAFNLVGCDNKITVDNASDKLEILYAGEREKRNIFNKFLYVKEMGRENKIIQVALFILSQSSK